MPSCGGAVLRCWRDAVQRPAPQHGTSARHPSTLARQHRTASPWHAGTTTPPRADQNLFGTCVGARNVMSLRLAVMLTRSEGFDPSSEYSITY